MQLVNQANLAKPIKNVSKTPQQLPTDDLWIAVLSHCLGLESAKRRHLRSEMYEQKGATGSTPTVDKFLSICGSQKSFVYNVECITSLSAIVDNYQGSHRKNKFATEGICNPQFDKKK